MYTLNIFLIIGFLYFTEGWDIKFHYCRFRCSNSCESPKDISKLIGIRNLIHKFFPQKPLPSNPKDDAKAKTDHGYSVGSRSQHILNNDEYEVTEETNVAKIKKPPPIVKGYYFRDFYGVIPPDAYPLGPSTQFPQTYIGLVYDPHNNGTYATTIYDGIDYVYNAVLNDTIKISEHIQILCTKSPESLYWFKLTNENYNSITSQGYRVVRAAFHQGFPNNTQKYFPHYIVKTDKCQISYAGVVSGFSAEMEYALIDGTHASSDDYMWLMYKATESKAKTPEAMKTQASISFSLSGNVGSQIRPVSASAGSVTAFPYNRFVNQQTNTDFSSSGGKTGFSANIQADHNMKLDKNISSTRGGIGLSANIQAKNNMKLDKDSIIPNFLTSLTVGSCSITCKNKYKSKSEKVSDVKSSSSMAYFWQPKGAIDKDDALPAGSDLYNDIAYIGQAPLYGLNLYDTGPSSLKSALIQYRGAMIEETSYFHVFSTHQPEKFIWVNTTTEDFSKLDENKLIPGGAQSNGTVSYVCRIIDERNSFEYIGGGRVLPTGTQCFSHYGGESEFQVLMYKQE